MDLKKCKNDHFYDGDKYSECPHCKKNKQSNDINNSADFSEKKKITEDENLKHKTKSIYATHTLDGQNERRDIEQSNIEIPSATKETNKTNNYGPVVGWLVGISGNEYGHSYELFATNNTIGSSRNNIVCIAGDSHLCNESHGVLCYQAEQNQFYFSSELSNGKVKINNYQVSQSIYVNYMDVLEIGESSYILVPLCKDGFSWWQNSQKNVDSFAVNTIQTSNKTNSKKQIINDIDEALYEQTVNYNTNNYYDGDEDDQDLTSVLISSPWRCSSCNALNSMMATKCRICGKKK